MEYFTVINSLGARCPDTSSKSAEPGKSDRAIRKQAKWEKSRDEQDRAFNAARARKPDKALSNAAAFWPSTNSNDEFLKASYWKTVSDTLPAKPFRFKKMVEAMLFTCVFYNVNKVKQAGHRTVDIKFIELRRFARELHVLGMEVTSPCLLKKKHLVRFIQAMEQGTIMKDNHAAKAKTLQTAHSSISALYIWAGRSSEIVKLADCVLNPESARITYEIVEDPSPAAKGVNAYKLVEQLVADPTNQKQFLFGWQAAAMVYFGLRIHEVMRFKPFLDLRAGGKELHIVGKGGRPRVILLDEIQQRIGDRLKEAMPIMFGANCEKHFLAFEGRAEQKMKASIKRFYREAKKIGFTRDSSGVTAHVLRKEFALEEMKSRGLKIMQFENSVQLEDAVDAEVEKRKFFDTEKAWSLLEEQEAMCAVAEQLGHTRTSVMRAYGRLASEPKIKKTLRLNASQNKLFIEQYLLAVSVDDLMVNFGLSQRSVYRKARSFNLPTPEAVRRDLELVSAES
jgi:integrase